MADIWVTCINLENRPERRSYMADQLGALAISATFTTAVRAGSEEFDALVHEKGIHPSGPWGPMSPATQACLLSHLKALRNFLTTDAEYALIFEDDAELSRELPEWLSDTGWIPSQADIVRLEYWPSRQKMAARADFRPHRGRKLYQLESRTSGGAGYIIRRAAARQVVERAAGERAPIDHVLFNVGSSRLARDLTTFQVVPGLVRQSQQFETDIVPMRKLLGRKKNSARVEFRRGLIELRPLPHALWLFVRGRAVVLTNTYQDVT